MQHERAALVSLTCAQSRVCPFLLPSCSQQRRSDSWQLAAPRRTAARARRAKAKCERLYLGERDRRRDDGLGHRHRHLGRVHARRERANLERIRAGKEGNSNASLVQHFDSLCTEHNHDASGGDPRADGPEWPLRRRGMWSGEPRPTWGFREVSRVVSRLWYLEGLDFFTILALFAYILFVSRACAFV